MFMVMCIIFYLGSNAQLSNIQKMQTGSVPGGYSIFAGICYRTMQLSGVDVTGQALFFASLTLYFCIPQVKLLLLYQGSGTTSFELFIFRLKIFFYFNLSYIFSTIYTESIFDIKTNSLLKLFQKNLISFFYGS